MDGSPAMETEARAVGATVRLARFAAETASDALPASVLHVLRLSMLDWIAVGVRGCEEPVSGIVRDMVAAEGGAPEATVFGLDRKLPARAAALVNGTTSHALDYDDTHFIYIGHPSVAVLPAAFAMVERTGASGAETLAAALIGMETACRTGAWMGRDHYQKGFHQTATSGSVGAAAAAGRLLGLGADRMAHALGLAATMAAGLKSQFGTMGKPFHAGRAASAGVEAALLAASGFVSRPDGLECEQGLAATHAGEMKEGALGEPPLGKAFVFETVQHKFHACCHGTHAVLEALGELRAAHGLAAEDVAGVTVAVPPRFLSVCNIPTPVTGLEAKFSYRHTAAMVLAGEDTGALDSYSDESCTEPGLAALRETVRVEADPELPETAARVTVERRDGSTVDGFHDIETPLGADVREGKVRAKAAALLGEARADACWSALAGLGAAAVSTDLSRLIDP